MALYKYVPISKLPSDISTMILEVWYVRYKHIFRSESNQGVSGRGKGGVPLQNFLEGGGRGGGVGAHRKGVSSPPPP